MYDLSWLNPTPHAIAVYASQPLSPVATQHSLPSGRYALLGPDFHRLDRTSLRLAHFAVGTRVTSRPPHRSVRAAFPHTAPTSGIDGSRLPYASQHPVSRLSGSESSACLIGPHSPWSLPFAPPTPQRIVPLCSSASQLLWQSQTSRVRSSSATAPRLPDAGRQRHHRSGQTRDLPASDAILLQVMWP